MDETSLHPTFQESLAVGLNLKICHHNIKGILASKSNYLSCLMREQEIIVIHETHTISDLHLLNIGKLLGFKLIGTIHSNVHAASQRSSEILWWISFRRRLWFI
jgi:hypothetical protein